MYVTDLSGSGRELIEALSANLSRTRIYNVSNRRPRLSTVRSMISRSRHLLLTSTLHLQLHILVLSLVELVDLPCGVIISRIDRKQEQRHDRHPLESDLEDPKGRLPQDSRSGVGFFCRDLQTVKQHVQTKFAPGRLGIVDESATHQPVDGDDDEDGCIYQSRTTDPPADSGMTEED